MTRCNATLSCYLRFSQALIMALYVSRLAWSPCMRSPLNEPKARCRCLPFAKVVMHVTTLAGSPCDCVFSSKPPPSLQVHLIAPSLKHVEFGCELLIPLHCAQRD